MTGLVSLVRVLFIVTLFSPVVVRYIVIKKPASERVGSLLAIGYAVGCYFLVKLISTLRMIAYLNLIYGGYNYVSPLSSSSSINIALVFWQAIFSSILVALLFYFARFILRKGHNNVESQNEEYVRENLWWSNILIRQILFFVMNFIIIFTSKVFEIIATS